MRVHDVAVDEGVDPDKFLLPDAWRARVLQVLEDRKKKRQITRVSLTDSDDEGDTGASEALDVLPAVLIVTLGTRWLPHLPVLREFGSVDEGTKKIIEKLAKEVEETRCDPGEHRVSNAVKLLGLVDACDESFGVFMSDPGKDTSHLGMSAEVQEALWRQNKNFFTSMFGRAQEAIKSGIRDNKRQVTMIAYCRSGRHRSVASAEILAAVLRVEGYEASVVHACNYWWKWVACQKKARRYDVPCDSCVREITPGKAEIYGKAQELWRSLQSL